MAETKFRMGEKGEVDIFDIPLTEHRAVSDKLGVTPDIYVHSFRPNMFYKVVAMVVGGVTITFYSIDSRADEANDDELAQIVEIKEARRARVVSMEGSDA